jgi:hypothetical protein
VTALAHSERVHAGAMDTSWPHIWQETPADTSFKGDGRGEASIEAAHWEEETMAILDRCGRLAETESE